MNSFSRDDIAQEHQAVGYELALLLVDVELLFVQHFEDLSEVLQMLLWTRAIHENVVKINHHKPANKRLENKIH